ncbi:Sir2 family NAD-dependent protein deacetylase [Humibacter ginsenosidimutans]|uniref:protein acetyllysine N-acetyltransferase n=1 Tax=Humibacter ginsenosidimutans TaxID=2599293 RepID=A0A5B8M1F1_9MICO|nr:Sir2 family NAD-dependent protein deacetylase [Humibacter ginsenosidimutans]QDZ13739.1 NAD-dependent deacetylase [Humibacter ginsenosidimutans]
MSTAATAEQAIESAIDILADRTVAVLTGAGISTDSGIPDYRGEGAPKRTPMSYAQFLNDPRSRKRYWAGSHLGYARFRAARPNAGHVALALMEAAGVVPGVITQNVDGLHTQAGSRRVVPLHGTMDRVVCLRCGQMFAREDIARQIDDLNPWLSKPDAVTIAPDGDADVTDVDSFVIPPCSVCGGPLKPDVVFFGEFVPPLRFQAARELVDGADALLVAGSSLAVNSGIRLVEQARRRKLPIVVINRGETKGDARATLKLNAGTSETLVALADTLIS